MPTLHLLPQRSRSGGHDGEVLCCAYTPDSNFVLSGGWDGMLRLWNTATGEPVTEFRANEKPISACAVSPDGKKILAGTLEGLLGTWNALSMKQESIFLAHNRPISGIVYSLDTRLMATCSWDSNVIVWSTSRERDGRTFGGHTDIITGCGFTPSAKAILSWSQDRTVRIWDVNRTRQLTELTGHEAKITAGAVSPDGRWAASGGADGMVKLWDLQVEMEAGSMPIAPDLRGCYFLLDGESLLTVDVSGGITILDVPTLEVKATLITNVATSCTAMSASTRQVALGSPTGGVTFVGVDDLASPPLTVPVTRTAKKTQSTLGRLVGVSSVVYTYHGNCPACRAAFDFPGIDPAKPVTCPTCRRDLRIGDISLRL